MSSHVTTNCRLAAWGTTTSAPEWLVRNMKPLYQAASLLQLNLVLLHSGYWSEQLGGFYLNNVSDVYCCWRGLFLKGCPATVQYVLHKSYLVYETSGCTVGQLFRGHTGRNTMQYYSALLIPLTAMSALDVPKYTENNVHTHTSSFPQRTWSTLCDFWGPSLMSVFIYSCSSVQRSFIVSPQTVGVGDWRSRPLAAVILPDEAVCAA